MKYISYSICLLFFVAGCTKPEQYDIVPNIWFESFDNSSHNVGELMKITIGFTDGDGDIGKDPNSGIDTALFLCNNNSSDTLHKIFYPDSLKKLVSTYYIQNDKDICVNTMNTEYIPNTGKYKSIKGEIDYLLTTDMYKQCSPSPCIDTQYFYIRIRDRAGNFSNVIKTPAVFVTGN